MLFALFSYKKIIIMVLSEKKKNIIGKALLLVTTIIWGSSFIILKDTISNFGGGHFTFFVLASRFFIASAVFFIVFFKKMIKINIVTVKKGIVLGLILFGAYAVQTVGLNYTTPSKNAFLTSSYCIIVPFLSWLILKQKPQSKHFVSAILCLTGIAFVALFGKKESGSNEFLGDMLTLGCGLFYALQIIYNDKYVGSEDPVQLIVVELFTVSILCIGISAVVEFPKFSQEFKITGEVVWKVLYLALFATGFAQLAQIIGQKFCAPTTSSLILTLESVFGVLFEILLGDARLTILIGVGFLLIFIANVLIELGFDGIKGLFIKKKDDDKKIRNNS